MDSYLIIGRGVEFGMTLSSARSKGRRFLLEMIGIVLTSSR